MYRDEVREMRQHMDPGLLTADDISARLAIDDPSRWRQVLEDLDYRGTEPNWLKH